MITKINKIKCLGIFNDFKWDTTPPFRRYNLIYGWNGTGKTTLSKLFSLMESGEVGEYEGCEYEFETDQERFTHGVSFPSKIRVFNNDYITRNVSFLEGNADAIVILGEESKETLERIKKNQTLLNGDPNDLTKIGLLRELKNAKEQKQRAETTRDGLFTSVARTIGATFGGQAIRSYTRSSSQPDFRALQAKETLSPEDLITYSSVLDQKEGQEIAEVTVPKTLIKEKMQETIEHLALVMLEAFTLLAQKVDVVAIERLRQNTDISNWVEEGLHLHKAHESKECEFCGQNLPEKRIEELSAYFNTTDTELKKKIDIALDELREIYKNIQGIRTPDKALLYADLREGYSASITNFEEKKDFFLKEIAALAEVLKDKKLRTWEIVPMENPSTSSQDFLSSLEEVNTFITRHNNDSKDLEKKRENARNQIKTHHLSLIWDDILALDKEIGESETKIEVVTNGDESGAILGINQINKLIETDQQQVSSAHNGCAKLNEMLKELLGRDEIIFNIRKDAEDKIIGYVIKRGEEIAKDVSDGEQMAIAFAYFCVRLGDKDFNIKEGIVVLDDPVSSLDSGMLFRVVAHIESHLIRAKQLFIFTHNYELFNHLKQWFSHSPQINNVKEREDGELPEENGRLLMIQSVYDATNKCRAAKLMELDELLLDYETEYHYLFKKLLQFDEENPEEEGLSIKSIYDYPNMTRKHARMFSIISVS